MTLLFRNLFLEELNKIAHHKSMQVTNYHRLALQGLIGQCEFAR